MLEPGRGVGVGVVVKGKRGKRIKNRGKRKKRRKKNKHLMYILVA